MGGGGTDGAGDCVRDVVQFQIQEDIFLPCLLYTAFTFQLVLFFLYRLFPVPLNLSLALPFNFIVKLVICPAAMARIKYYTARISES